MKSLKEIKDSNFLAILIDVKEELLALFGQKLRQIILYGSYARNVQEPESDIDIMILVDESDAVLRNYNDRLAGIMTDLSLKYDKLISLNDETYSRYIQYLDVLPFFQHVRDEGIEIYGKKTA